MKTEKALRRRQWLEQRKEKRKAQLERAKLWLCAKLDRMVPPGFAWGTELKWLGTGLGLCVALNAILFFGRYWNDVEQMYVTDWSGGETKRVLRAGANLSSFSSVMRGTMVGFSLLMLVILLLTVYHYLYYYRDSKSIYVMKRLPNRFELHRRSLSLPLVSVGVCLLAVFLLIVIEFGLYYLMAPAGCEISPNQWASFWRMGIRLVWEADGI